MTKLKEIKTFLDQYLKIKSIKDDSINGLQFKAKDQVKKIGFSVDVGLEIYKKAKQNKVDLIIVHHGEYWKSVNKKEPIIRKRIAFLKNAGISLYAAHLPLDKHPVVGNNIQLFKIIKCQINKPAIKKNGKFISWVGINKNKLSLDEIKKILERKLKTKCIVLPYGPKKIRRIIICSGGPKFNQFMEAINKCELYISGGTSEINTVAQDSKINVIFARHYNTETVGLKALMKVIESKFKCKTVFLDLPTPY